MANIVKDSSNRVYQNPAKLLFLIPIGCLIFIILFDFVFLKYNEYRLNKATETVIINTLDHEEFSSVAALEDYVQKKYEELGYKDNTKLSVVVRDKYIIVNNTYSFFSLKGYVFNREAHATSIMVGYYDEYKSPTVINYVNDMDIPSSNYPIFESQDVKIN